jgi:internalin A
MSTRGEFVIEEDAQGNSLVITGAWSDAAAQALKRGLADRLVLNYARGFTGTNLDFLDRGLGLRRLDLLHRSIESLEPIARLGNSLEELSVQAANGAELDLQSLPRLRVLAGEWSLIAPTLNSIRQLSSLVTWRFGETDLHDFRDHVELERLTIKEAPHLRSLSGVSDLSELEMLEIVDAKNLSDVSDVVGLVESLRELKLETCRSIDSIDDLGFLVRLRILELSDCGDVDSFAPLEKLEQLEQLHAWGSTRVVDADLSPIQSLPHLHEVRMQDRRGYRPRLADVVASLSEPPPKGSQ